MARRKHGRRAGGDVLLDGKRYRLVGDLEPAAYARAAERVAAIMARTPEYAEAPAERWKVFELTGSFFDVVKLPFGTRDRIASAYPSVEDWDALIQAAWDAALKHRALRRDGEGAVIFPLPLPMTSYAGHPAELVVAPSRYRDAGQTWYAPFCAYRKPRAAAAEPVFAFGAGAREALPVYATDEEVHRRARAEEAAMRAEASVAGVTGEAGIAPYAQARYVEKRALLDYAWLGNEAETLGKLARMAEPERWDDGSDGPLGVLRNYLFGVFSAAQRQGLVLERPQDDFAAFNTGLTTPFCVAGVHVLPCEPVPGAPGVGVLLLCGAGRGARGKAAPGGRGIRPARRPGAARGGIRRRGRARGLPPSGHAPLPTARQLCARGA